MAKTSKDARRHIREWSKFFADGKAVAKSAVEEFIKSYKKQKYLRQSLDRLMERGLVIPKDNEFVPTARGGEFFKQKIEPKNKKATKLPWRGKWYFVMFDVPVIADSKRHMLRNLLRRSMFYPIQKSVWVSPLQLTKKFWKDLVNNDLDKYCKVLSTNILEGDRELKEYFKHFVEF